MGVPRCLPGTRHDAGAVLDAPTLAVCPGVVAHESGDFGIVGGVRRVAGVWLMPRAGARVAPPRAALRVAPTRSHNNPQAIADVAASAELKFMPVAADLVEALFASILADPDSL